MNDEIKRYALSFGAVADAYDRARPSYPEAAARWLTGGGQERLSVLELGAGTGLLTQTLVAHGHRVVATDPSPEMLGKLRERVAPYSVGVSGAEAIPAPDRSIDVVVCAQSFHWFDHGLALPEIARVLRPGGHLALVWNQRDASIPWVRRLGQAIGDDEGGDTDLVAPVRDSSLFGEVDEQNFRCWQDLRKDALLDLVLSRSAVATLEESARAERLARVGALYDDLGRGPDGLRLPYVTLCYRAQVIHPPEPPRRPPVEMTEDGPAETGTAPAPEASEPRQPEPPADPGHLLIDFR